jgi:hypothetical protein
MFSRATNDCDRANVADDCETPELFINCFGADKRVVPANDSASAMKNKFN